MDAYLEAKDIMAKQIVLQIENRSIMEKMLSGSEDASFCRRCAQNE
jgi:hypothetical protein